MGCDGVRLQSFGDVPISIHAPTWGATSLLLLNFTPTKHFNPRTHVGCDLRCVALPRIYGISIHAPTWGATLRISAAATLTFYFNPRTHVGCDTPTSSSTRRGQDFNPRTHVGCDRTPPRPARRQKISIHAPTWGATYGQHVCNSTAIFQSTHPRGVRPRSYASLSHTILISIHAPTWGATSEKLAV